MNKVAVVIETARHQICGHVAVPAVSRLSDYANDPQRRFWSVTDAEISSSEGPDRSRRVPFILIAAHEISMISPIATEKPPAERFARPTDYVPVDATLTEAAASLAD